MACLDGDIYLRKDFITCNPNNGVSLKSLMQSIVDELVINSGTGGTGAFSCNLLNNCGIGSLADVIIGTPSTGDVLTRQSDGTYRFVAPAVSGATKLSELSDVSGTDGLGTPQDGYVLKYSNGDNRFVPGPLEVKTNTLLTIGTEEIDKQATISLNNTDSSNRPTDFSIVGAGGVNVSFDPNKRVFTISLYSAPSFTSPYIRPNSNTLNNKIYVGQTLTTLNFGFAGISNKANLKPSSGVDLKGPKYNGTSFVNNSLIKNFPYQNTNTTYLTDETSNSTQTGSAYLVDNVGNITYSLSGTGKDDSLFVSSVSISRVTTLYYGSVSDRDHVFTNTIINGSSSREISVLTNSFEVTTGGNYPWFAVPTVIYNRIENILFSQTATSSTSSLARYRTESVANVNSTTGVAVPYTLVVGANAYSAASIFLHIS